ncbi:MAG: phosphatidylinositol-specific phospholipase C domain-containing protein [bacterium]
MKINVFDRESFRGSTPVLIAHRGGVVTAEAPECSLEAIRLAAQHGYRMVELDIQESKDHVPIVFHDRNMYEDCGIEKEISDLTVEEIAEVYLFKTGQKVRSDQRISTSDEALAVCSELGLGVMLDIKTEGSEQFFRRIAEGIEKYGFDRSTVSISLMPTAQKLLDGKVMFRMSSDDIARVERQEPLSLQGKFWFGEPKYITNDMVRECQRRGALVIPAINIFRYPSDTNHERAKEDIARMKQAGADAYQIDSVYEAYFRE